MLMNRTDLLYRFVAASVTPLLREQRSAAQSQTVERASDADGWLERVSGSLPLGRCPARLLLRRTALH